MSIYEPTVTGVLQINNRRGKLQEHNLEIPPGLVTEFNLRTGDTITGYSRQGKLYKIKKINGLSPTDSQKLVRFENLLPAHPTQRILLEDGSLEMRILDLIAPIARGQRAIVVAPPKSGKTILLKKIAQTIIKNKDLHLMALLVMERPEELLDFQDIEGLELFASTFDQTNQHHVTISRTAIEKAKRLVEQGKDVVLLLDSLTRLTRACNVLTPSHGKLLSGGLDASALQFPKELFGSARNIKGNNGSLTIIATCLSETDSKLDDAILTEFCGTGNSDVILSREIADKKLYPAIDVKKSGTRRDELMLHPDEKIKMDKLRSILSNCAPHEAIQFLRQKLGTYKTNAEFLMNLNGI